MAGCTCPQYHRPGCESYPAMKAALVKAGLIPGRCTCDVSNLGQPHQQGCELYPALKAGLSAPEPDPVPNDTKPVWEMVIEDMKERDDEGRRKYGTPLQINNGRDPLVDAYQEALDLVVYLRQAIEERQRNERS